MGSVTYGSICEGIAEALRSAKIGKSVQSYKDLTESIPENKTLHVYFNDADTTSGSGTDRKTFQASNRTTMISAVIDGYARKRSNLKDDLVAQMELIDEIDGWLCEQKTGTLLGVSSIRSFHWRWERATLPFNKDDWAGCRFSIEIWIY